MTSESKNSRIEDLRTELRHVDDQIIDLVRARLKIVKGIGDYKKSQNMSIQDDIQERRNLTASITRAMGEIPKEMIEELTRLLASWGRKLQE